MNAGEIERLRQVLRGRIDPDLANRLCELALDGLKFRAWCEGATRTPARFATGLAGCLTVKDYRTAIERLMHPGLITRPRARPR